MPTVLRISRFRFYFSATSDKSRLISTLRLLRIKRSSGWIQPSLPRITVFESRANWAWAVGWLRCTGPNWMRTCPWLGWWQAQIPEFLKAPIREGK